MGTRQVRDLLSRSETAQRAYRTARSCASRGRLTVERFGLAARGGGRPAAQRGRILAYHSIGTPSWGVNDVSPRRFEQHLTVAIDAGWTFATPAQVLAEPEKPLLAITFDDGIASVLHNAVPVLRHHGIPATMFVVTGWADGKHPNGHRHLLDWSGVDELQRSGITIASHSVSHPDFGRLPAAEARRELEVSRDRLRRVLGVHVDEFAIPLGQSKNWTADAAAAATAAGYTRVYAQAVNTRPDGTVPRTFITRVDRPALFRAALGGAFDSWEEWY
jgi:peptidoglycan/xylan/chitin deacetylase (PgdA/CDA1 family)